MLDICLNIVIVHNSWRNQQRWFQARATEEQFFNDVPNSETIIKTPALFHLNYYPIGQNKRSHSRYSIRFNNSLGKESRFN